MNNAALDLAVTVVESGDFYRAAHRTLYAAMVAMRDAGKPIDMVMLRDWLGKRMEEVGGPAYISSLMDGVPRSSNVVHYASIVWEKAQLRLAIAAAEELVSEAYDAALPAAQVVERGVSRLLADVTHRGGLVTELDAVEQYTRSIESGEAGAAVPTGYAAVDDMIVGLKRGEFAIVAARPSVGKTAFMIGMAQRMSQRGYPPVVFSLEMSQMAIASRLLVQRARVPAHRLEQQQASELDYGRVGAALSEMAEAETPVMLECTATTVAEISAWCRRAPQPPACLLVDYIQLLVAERQRASDEAEMASVSRALKRLAKDTNSVVVGLSQLSRAPEGRKDKRPHTSDLRGSGALEQDCDVALLLFRPELYGESEENDGIAEVIVAKNRNGPTGVVRMAFIKELAMFDNLEWRT